ncbi:polyprotein (retrotrasposon protein) [Pyrus ussuriensis x Pyrus communis]|uniref:Polyprotein (Retrotrasposon protein) n=1 Tax=Pyrus ussuriensis x Pyrus communis TaxID=2448454 RepID=A0A5N5HWX0_9ROSA|nr:polyprotein (retrotrasposon protein) [Pyrus ussuriensis x Pyrus communis]
MAKSHHASFPISDSKDTLPFDLIHSDVWGPAKVTSNGFHWFITFIDDCTRLTCVFLMKNKSDVPLLLQEFCAMRSKLNAYALRCVFIGYANNQNGYKCYHPLTQKTYITMDLPVSMSNELPFDDRLHASGMSNELPNDGSSSDGSSNTLVQDSDIHEFDVKNDFLHDDLNEEVYMDLSPGIEPSPGKLTGDDQKKIQRLQKYLATEFEMKELGELKYFLGIKGRLIYLSHTRPNIAYAVSVISQFMHSPNEAHMDMASGRGLVFSKNGHLNVEGRKQKVVARSSAKAEFRDQLADVLTKTGRGRKKRGKRIILLNDNKASGPSPHASFVQEQPPLLRLHPTRGWKDKTLVNKVWKSFSSEFGRYQTELTDIRNIEIPTRPYLLMRHHISNAPLGVGGCILDQGGLKTTLSLKNIYVKVF